MIRVAQQNAHGIVLCCQSLRDRRPAAFDTRIKRRNVIDALNGILAGTYKGKYREEIINIARSLK
jgi:hypothetical protein